MPAAKDVVAKMLENEKAAIVKRGMYEYVSLERSERNRPDTCGWNTWLETPQGRIRFLMQEDGKPLSAEREAQERGQGWRTSLTHQAEFGSEGERAEGR